MLTLLDVPLVTGGEVQKLLSSMSGKSSPRVATRPEFAGTVHISSVMSRVSIPALTGTAHISQLISNYLNCASKSNIKNIYDNMPCQLD